MLAKKNNKTISGNISAFFLVYKLLVRLKIN